MLCIQYRLQKCKQKCKLSQAVQAVLLCSFFAEEIELDALLERESNWSKINEYGDKLSNMCSKADKKSFKTNAIIEI